jgi:hypothetical protein
MPFFDLSCSSISGYSFHHGHHDLVEAALHPSSTYASRPSLIVIFKGYDQGVMGGVNASPKYVMVVGIGLLDGTIMNIPYQEGIVRIVGP